MRFIDYSGKSVRYVGNTTGISKDMRGLDISLSERISKFAVSFLIFCKIKMDRYLPPILRSSYYLINEKF